MSPNRFLAVAALAAIGRADVIVVAPSGGQHAQIQSAVLAASAGDVLLVRTGVYAPVTVDGKALTITADDGADVVIQGTTTVVNLPAGSVVVLSGLRGSGQTSSDASEDAGAALVLRSNAGCVRIEGCELTGATGFGDNGTGTYPGTECCNLIGHDAGWDAARVDACPGGTSFMRTTLRGGRAANAWYQCWCGVGDRGGAGLRAIASAIAIYDCTLLGGRGGNNGEGGGPGGAGLHASASLGALASSTTIRGGDGGNGDDWAYSWGGAGGDGVRLEAGTFFQQIGCALAGGAGGIANGGAFPPGPNGASSSGTGSFHAYSVPSLTLVAPGLAREGASVPIRVRGVPGGVASLRMARLPGFQHLPSWRGISLVQPPIPERMRIVGTIPPGGEVQDVLLIPALPAGVPSTTWYVQASVRHPIDGTTLGTGQVLTILDASY